MCQRLDNADIYPMDRTKEGKSLERKEKSFGIFSSNKKQRCLGTWECSNTCETDETKEPGKTFNLVKLERAICKPIKTIYVEFVKLTKVVKIVHIRS